MNSYPPELLAQLAPVMFVAGLDAVTAAPPATPQSPSPRNQDPFAVLAARLKEALVSQRKVAVWQQEKSKIFQAVLVDPDVRFPPRKIPPAEDQQFHPMHSPLSPLTPSSPLYPDGLVAPIWIRKHTTLVPSVFVLFKRLFEYSQAPPRSPLDAPDVDREREREAEEKKRDTELAAEIARRKKSTSERSIKLTVVLMASRRMLDDPALDARLTYIRRQSGLDPRAALFVLSPVSQSEIGDFVRSLQEALYEPAIEYYTNHSKRVRRKRNRHSQASVSYPVPTSPAAAANALRPLRPEGWTVRYEYKMACFAEFRGEDDLALKHYQDAYNALHIMFGSTAILPPRTKRWAEAKVLSDCISLKICKLYLYNNEHSLALAHHTSHMRKFSDLSRGWGIGEETFEYWSFLARQHRVFAELLEHGTRSNLTIPTHSRSPSSTASLLAQQALDPQRGALEIEAMRVLGLNPTHALQHPGFYYHMAARSTENRRERFLRALENESPYHAVSSSPGFANEKKVDHLTIILELYTRAYELFKKYSPSNSQSQGRLTLWIAYRIAQTYYESGKFDMAVRFFERIAKTYRREKWDAMLRPLLSTWYACAQQLGDMELSVQLLLEMVGHGSTIDQDDPESIQDDLLAILKSTVPSSSDQALVVDLTDSSPLVDSTAIFWTSEVKVEEAAAYQISLTAPSGVFISSLPFSSLTIYFSEDHPSITVMHSSSEPEGKDDLPLVQRVDLGHIAAEEEHEAQEVEANLRWRPGASLVLSGTLSSSAPTTLTVSKMVLTIKEQTWWIELPLQPNSSRPGYTATPSWLSSLDPVRFIPIRRDDYSSAIVRHQPHRVEVSFSYQAPAYVGEEFPIMIDVTNADERELEVVVDVLLQPTEFDEAGAVNFIHLDEERSPSLIKGAAFGNVAPGMRATKTLYLGCEGAAGDRVIDISVRTRNVSTPILPTSPGSPTTPPVTPADIGETLRTIAIPTVSPIKVERSVTYRKSLKPQPGLADLATYDPDFWDDGDGGEALVMTNFSCVGPSGIAVESIKLTRQDGDHAKVVDCMVDDGQEDFLTDWLPGDEFGDQCRVTLALDAEDLDGEPIAGPGTYELSWRRLLPGGAYGSLATSRFPLPPLKPPVDELVALLDVPTTAKLHTPIPLRLTVRNRHPDRSANILVHLEPDPADGFVLAGLRSGRLPILLPGGEEVLTWNLIPVECGFVKIPRIKVTNRRPTIADPTSGSVTNLDANEDGTPVKIVDVRWDRRPGADAVCDDGPRESVDSRRNEANDCQSPMEAVVLVLP